MHSWDAPAVPALAGSAAVPRLMDALTNTQRPVTDGPELRMYVCGITPYDAAHLGHAATYVAFDQLQRIARDAGLTVLYAQNVTDVDDPLLVRAQQTGEDWQALAERETDRFRDDMASLRVIPPDHYIGVVESMDLISRWVADLRDAGLAYELDGDWYLSVAADPAFGRLAGYDSGSAQATFAERGGDPERSGKKHPLDFLLWSAAREGEPSWPSPVGSGRPGWHVECVAIADQALGLGFDVQGGGSDLAFPHHEMCACLAAVCGRGPFAQHYVHTGLVALDGEKMSKSKGNLEFVSRLRLQGHDPMAIRLALLAHHYRDEWEWRPDLMDDAAARLALWRQGVERSTGPEAPDLIGRLRAALSDDLDTPAALAAMDEWSRQEGDAPEGPSQARSAVDALLGIALVP